MIKRIIFRFVGLYIEIIKLFTQKEYFVFISLNGTYKDNLKYFYEYMQNNCKEKIVWINYNDSLDSPTIISKMNLKFYFYIAKARVLIEDVNVDLLNYVNTKKVLRINLSHGNPIRCVGKLEKNIDINILYETLNAMEKLDFFCNTTHNTSKRLALSYTINQNKILNSGYPRNDFLIQNKSKNRTRNLDFKKVLLYAPTWRRFGERKNFDLIYLNQVLEQCNYLLLIKSHHLDSLLVENLTSIKNVSSIHDIQELLMESDVLISDYSSVVVDYALLERPIIFYCYDYEEYKDKVGLYDEIKDIYDGPITYDFDELISAIKNIDSFIHQAIVDFKNKFHDYCDGNSSQRVYEAIQNKLKEKNI